MRNYIITAIIITDAIPTFILQKIKVNRKTNKINPIISGIILGSRLFIRLYEQGLHFLRINKII